MCVVEHAMLKCMFRVLEFHWGELNCFFIRVKRSFGLGGRVLHVETKSFLGFQGPEFLLAMQENSRHGFRVIRSSCSQCRKILDMVLGF